jgi:hypothetical protein
MCLDCPCGDSDRQRTSLHRPPVAAEIPMPIAPTALEPLGLRLLAHNDRQAEVNRRHFDAAGVRVVPVIPWKFCV